MSRSLWFLAGVVVASAVPGLRAPAAPATPAVRSPAVAALPARDDGDEDDAAARKHKKVVALLEAMNTKEVSVRSLDTMMDTFTQMGLDGEFQSCFKDHFDVDRVLEFTAAIYEEQLDEETIDGAIVFYRSDTGRAFVEKMPEIMIEGVRRGSEYGKEVAAECVRGR